MSTTQVYYDGKRIIPAINLNYSRNFQQSPDGKIVGQVYNVTFSSTIFADKGSPTSSGVFWTVNDYPPDENIPEASRLSSIIKKQTALRELFNKNNIGKKFEVIPEDGVSTLYFFPSSVEIVFQEGPWYNTCEYSISMVADKIYPDIDSPGLFNLESALESWSIDPNEQPLGTSTFTPGPISSLGATTPFAYRVTHSLSATGKVSYVSGVKNNPFLEAKKWIATRTGISNTIFSGFNNLSGLGAYNHIFTENIDESNGSYSVSENWLFSSGNIIENYNVSTQGGLDGTIRVEIGGDIQGLEKRVLSNIVENKWVAASGYFASISNSFLARAQEFSSLTLNPIPNSYNIGRNPLQGSISYSYSFDNRLPSYISGALSQRIAVSYQKEGHSVAEVPVIGRSSPYRGPVLQDLGTGPAKQKTLSIDFILGPPSGVSSLDFNFPIHLVSGLVDQLDPINNGANKSFRQQPQENWEPLIGSASYNVTWIYE